MEKLTLKHSGACIDNYINCKQPNTITKLIDILERYKTSHKTSYKIEKIFYYGYLQGVKVILKLENKTQTIPGAGKVYSIFND